VILFRVFCGGRQQETEFIYRKNTVSRKRMQFIRPGHMKKRAGGESGWAISP
jgi:hypothetical protein